jgi:hypothetical protein
MLTLRKAWRRIAALFGRRRLDADLDAELAHHLALEEEKFRAAGLDPAEARRRARLAFGAVESLREATRDARGTRAVDDLARDVRHGIRTLVKRPGFAAIVLLTLGIGVGGSAAIYGAVDAILLTPLPYPEADRVLGVWQTQPDQGIDRLEPSPANFLDWRERSRSFRHLTALEPYGLDWQADDGPVYLNTWLVYEGFFETFGTAPLLGRTPRADEHQRGQAPVIVLGYGVWQRLFAGDPAVVGRVLTIDDNPTTVIGVMPEGFAMPSDDIVWAPSRLLARSSGEKGLKGDTRHGSASTKVYSSGPSFGRSRHCTLTVGERVLS